MTPTCLSAPCCLSHAVHESAKNFTGKNSIIHHLKSQVVLRVTGRTTAHGAQVNFNEDVGKLGKVDQLLQARLSVKFRRILHVFPTASFGYEEPYNVD